MARKAKPGVNVTAEVTRVVDAAVDAVSRAEGIRLLDDLSRYCSAMAEAMREDEEDDDGNGLH